MTESEPHDTSRPTDPVADGVEQFQKAAGEAINAARGLLDAAEAVVKDPAAIQAVVDTVTAMARTAVESVGGLASGLGGQGGAGAPAGGNDADDGDDGDDGTDGFTRIRVS